MSGGNRAAPWAGPVVVFLKTALHKGYNYAFAASEVDRLYGLALGRARVRHWEIREGICPAPKPPRLPAHLRRWQRQAVGELWQMDATPHRWFGLPPPTPSWGELLAQAQEFPHAWWLVLYPSLALFATMLAGVFVGEGLRAAFDPRRFGRLE